NLSYFKSLNPPPDAPDFVAPIGAEGVFPGDVKFKIIGAVVRSVTIDGVKYFWHEYLLYNPMVGFRWLVHSDNHWNFVEPVNAAEVEDTHFYGGGAKVKYNGEEYKIFQDANAVVEYVKGEFYWRVEQGEMVRATDYVSPPRMLSREATSDEINWSLGTYMRVEDIEKIFGISGLPRPWGVAPNQPFTGRFYYTWGALPILILLVVGIFMIPMRGLTKTVLNQQLTLPAMANQGTEQTVSSQPFDLKANNNVRISASAQVNNSWADLDVDLYNEQNQEIESVNVPIEYYSGVEDGESWSEGDQNQEATISSPGAGKYTLQIHGTWEQWQQPIPIQVKVEQGVNRGVNFCCAFLILLIVPVLGFFRRFSFESARWRDSMFGSSGSSSSSSSDDDD
ncbi:MAG: DUF4178 domain-containing protein, partial [Acidobacteriales bacterium]|nr:DUF4178 domain-containing protein [Terriglobales bacterium]